ncbi:MAG: 2-amino-4-hydroxy-6-hydroxymethyldihydropteridine diphosphokinase [Dehalococcoidia bacterium]
MTRIYLGLGANLGDREANLRRAVELLAASCEIIAVSSLYQSRALVPDGSPPGPDYLNAAVEAETELPAADLLHAAKEVERALGREPAERWAPRPIDVDILLYGDRIIDTAELSVPHPRMAERAFVLVPLAELAPDLPHPGLGRTAGELAAEANLDGLEHLRGPEWRVASVVSDRGIRT